MSEMEKLNLDELEEVVGGANVTVHNPTVDYANIREAPGLDSVVLCQAKNGTKLITTGKRVKKDGYIWCEVYLATGSDPGWVTKHLLDF